MANNSNDLLKKQQDQEKIQKELEAEKKQKTEEETKKKVFSFHLKSCINNR